MPDMVISLQGPGMIVRKSRMYYPLDIFFLVYRFFWHGNIYNEHRNIIGITPPQRKMAYTKHKFEIHKGTKPNTILIIIDGLMSD